MTGRKVLTSLTQDQQEIEKKHTHTHHLVFKALLNLEFDSVSHNFPTGVKGVDKHDGHRSQISTDVDRE